MNHPAIEQQMMISITELIEMMNEYPNALIIP
jgi:hypothetical protein